MHAHRLFRPVALATVAALLASAGIVWAQLEGGDRGVAPVASSGDFEVDGVTVDVSAKTADAARYGGWRLAQRKAWKQLSQKLGAGGAAVGDGTLDGLVSSIVVQNEQIGPTRYIATLGVVFDRARAGSLLGVSAYVARSAPMLVVPVEWSGGVAQVFETRTPWQQAWARFRTGSSAIDYARPSGTGADSLLLDAAQVGRRGRGWWRTLINLYGASNILIPTVRLYRQWPGGPVIGVFEARSGPDATLLDRFILRVPTAEGLPQLLDTGVQRMDDVYTAALHSGQLETDPGLSNIAPGMPQPGATPDAVAADPTDLPAATGPESQVTIQFDTPGAASVTAGEAALRAIPGVRSAATTSLALGGVSIMRVAYDGSPDLLKAALEARGYQVLGSGTALRIRQAPQLLPPNLPVDPATAG